jgi:hypothetical protein
MSMFYELVGKLLENSGEALIAPTLDDSMDVEREQRQVRQIALLMRRVGAILPDMFSRLERETEVLSSTLDSVVHDIREAGHDWEITVAWPRDPLDRYRVLNAELERTVVLLHSYYEEAWANVALSTLRRGMLQAAEIQGELVDRALSV